MSVVSSELPIIPFGHELILPGKQYDFVKELTENYR
jgi:hypothetical protein